LVILKHTKDARVESGALRLRDREP
jgi:hypothetical protein